MSSAPTGAGARRDGARPGSAQHPPVPLYRWAHVVILVTIVLVNLIQRPGYTTFDTKLDLTENPGGFIQDALTMWNPAMDMGSLQNQAYGYLFPVAPFFWIGDVVGVPMWLWQRLWSALVLLVAYEGMRRLARATGGLGPGAAVIAGLSYAMAPRVLGTVGVISGETLPGAVLPWTVLPLVHAWHRRQGWGRAVVLSAATLPFMSGLNATEVLCTLPLPGLVLMYAPQPWRKRLRWLATWCGLVLVACAWWLGPLLVMGRYAPPFLDYIESATSTTAPLGWLSVLRGSTHWVTFLAQDESHWITGHELTFQPVLVLVATVVAIVGLLGLVLRPSPLRRPLLLAAGLGLVVMALGHGGAGGSILADGTRAFLDGPGAPFRNIHKFDPVVRAGTAIGLAGSITWAAHRLRTSGLHRGSASGAAVMARVPAALALLLITVLTTPALAGDLRADDGWKGLPQPWRQMQQTLEALPEGSRVMILPGPGFVDHTWGRTVDEPAQTMKGVSWASRTQIPLVSPGGLRLLESIEERVSTGRPSAALAPTLAQAGFTHVLVRNDINPETTDVPSTARLHSTLQTSGGFRQGASYGVGDGGYPMLELYELTGLVPRARAVPTSGLRELAGESDQLISLGESGVLAPDELTVGTRSGMPVGARILTEGAEKRERSFGRVHDAITSVRTRDEPWEQRRAAHDYGTIDTATLTTVDYGPVARLATSSSADSTTIFGPVRRDRSGWAAFDGDPATSFATAPFTDPTKQWISLRLKRAQRIGTISMLVNQSGVKVTAIRVTTDAGARTVRVPSNGLIEIKDLGGRTDDVRIAAVGAREAGGQVHLPDIRFSELTPTRSEIVAAPADATTTMSFRTWPGRSECVTGLLGVRCEPGSTMQAEEAGGMARQVTLREGGEWSVTGLVRVTGGRVVDDLLLPLAEGVAVRASSVFVNEALASPSRAADGNPDTGWTSGLDDSSPWLDLSWKQPRALTRIDLSKDTSIPGERARVFGAAVDGKPVKLRPSGSGYVFDRPVRGRSLRITFHPTPKGERISVGEITVQGLGDLIYRPPDSARTGLPCGFGPEVTAGPQRVQTRIVGTIGDVKSGKPLRVEACSGQVRLQPGTHRLTIAPVDGFVPTALTLTPDDARRPLVRDLPLAITSWQPESRRIVVGGTQLALLALPENINDGWVARLGDRRLDPVTVDGWKQGFVVPAGSNRVVELTYAPGGPYRRSLLVGGVAALLLVLAAAYLLVRGGSRRVPEPHAAGAAKAAGATAVTTGSTAVPGRMRRPLAAVLALAGGLALFAGALPAVGFLAALALNPRWRAVAVVTVIGLATGSALWWALAVESEPVRMTVDLVMGLVLGAVLGLALGPWRRRAERSGDA